MRIINRMDRIAALSPSSLASARGNASSGEKGCNNGGGDGHRLR
jgi:hypothetical protein